MKKTILFAFILLATVALYGQNEKFTASMMANLEKSATAQTISDFQNLADNFASIAATEPNEWTPLYYAALNNLTMNWIDTDIERKEKYISLAKQQIDAGLKLRPDETELMVLKVMSYFAEISVNPMIAMNIIGEAYSVLGRAKSINPENPRIYLEEGEAIYNTPVEYGGGKEQAKPLLEIALEKFNKFVPENALSPNWGKDRCEMLLKSVE